MRSLVTPRSGIFSTSSPFYDSLAPLLACGGLILLVGAQTQLQERLLTPAAIGLLVLGLGAWLAALWIAPPSQDRIDGLAMQQRVIRWSALGSALGLVLLTWLTTDAGVYTSFNLSMWLLSIGMWCLAWWPQSSADPQPPRSRRSLAALVGALGVILALGAFFRFYRLADVPGEPTSDHAEKLLDVFDLVSGQRPIFFPRNTGREPGQFYITYGLMRLFDLPLAFDTLKLGTALIGLLAIPAVYLFAREVGGTTTGLIAAAGFAISKWVVNTARMGLRFPYGPLPTAIVLWLLFRYLRRGDRRDALWCGLAIGLGLHGYISFRIVPLLVPLLLGWALLTDRRWRQNLRRLIMDGLLIATTALITCLPLVRYTAQHPDQVWYRVATRAADAERELGTWGDLLGTFALNMRSALLAFNWRGDDTVVNAVHHDPFLDLVSGGALLAGLLIVGYQIVTRRASRYGALVLSIPVLMLPSTLNLAFPIENPSANRIGTVAPVIFLIVALPLAYLVEQLWPIAPGISRPQIMLRRVALVALLSGALGLATQQNYARYFHDYNAQYRLHVPNTQEIAREVERMQELGFGLERTYLLAFPYWLDGRNLALALGDLSWKDSHDLPAEVDLPQHTDQPLLFVLHPQDHERRRQLKEYYPDGTYAEVNATTPGKNFAMYIVPGR
jgi:hypothetical protein